MMNTSYDVRVWGTEVYRGSRGNTYYVRWRVAGRRWKEPFRSAALADSFRADLIAAARKGEAFEVDTGRPISMQRTIRDLSWYDFACAFVDLKWPQVAATTRRTHAEAMTAVTVLMLTGDRGRPQRDRPDDQLVRTALCRWAFNNN